MFFLLYLLQVLYTIAPVHFVKAASGNFPAGVVERDDEKLSK